MSKEYAVLTAIGADRVGIVDDISGELVSRGCNIEGSRMAVLGGEFAVIMLATGDSSAFDAIAAELPLLDARLSLRLAVRRTRPPAHAEAGRPYVIEAVSLDTPGIVHAVTSVLRGLAVNIEGLDTDTSAAPWTGAPMFRMRALVVLPAGVPVALLRGELARLEADHDLDITLKPALAPAAGESGRP